MDFPPELTQVGNEPPAGTDAAALQVFGSRLDGLFREQVAARSRLEERWLDDVRAYNGEYDPEILAVIQANKGSEAFVNLTRVKCNAAEARLSDMELPTDDRNWSIDVTPIPTLANLAGSQRPVVNDDGTPVLKEGKQAVIADFITEQTKEAKKRCSLMQQVMDDQLEECSYNQERRKLNHYRVVYGTGILKGPVLRNRVQQRFVKAGGTWQMAAIEDLAPGAKAVNPWDFFPDMRAATMDECEFVFERHRMSRKDLRELSRLPGFLPEQIDTILQREPAALMSGLVDQADSEALQGVKTRYRYEVLEYNGPINKDDLVAAGVEIDTESELNEYAGTVWFCNGTVIKAVLSLLESGDLMYDAVPFERDDTSIFGFGVPHIMRHSQRVGNSGWRMIIDNARAAIGPQVVWKRGKIVPSNGDPTIAPFKSWEVIDPNTSVQDAFQLFSVAPNFQEMFKILEVVREFTDEETGLPMIAQGQQSPAVTKTAQGMTILMNSANTVLRRLVKESDDGITRRFLKRLYQWNMQYSERDDAKGDYTIVPLGSSTLMVREQQAQQLMQLSQVAAGNPEFAKRTKWGELYAKIVQAMNLSSEGVTKSDEDVRQEEEAAAQQGPQMPPEIELKMAELEIEKADLEIRKAEADHRMKAEAFDMHLQAAREADALELEKQKVQALREDALLNFKAKTDDANARRLMAQTNREIALIRLAYEQRKTTEQVRAQLGMKAMDIDSSHRLFNSERAIKYKFGEGL